MQEKINIRKAVIEDAQSIAGVHLSTWQTTYKNIIDSQFLDNLNITDFENRRKANIINASIHTVVAETTEKKIIAFASCGYERTHDTNYKGEISALYVSQEYQQQGIGKMLFARCVDNLLKDNFNSMKIWVLKANKFQEFYMRQGGQVVEEKGIKLVDKFYQEIAYGGKNLSDL